MRTCGASIIIGSMAIVYYLCLWIGNLLFSTAALLLITISAVFCVYAYGFLVVLGVLHDLVDPVFAAFQSFFQLFSKDRLNPSQLHNFEGILDALWIVVAYFLAVTVFFSLFFYLSEKISESMGHIKFMFRIFWLRKKHLHHSSFCSICLCEDAKMKLDCGHSFHFQCIQKWK